MSKYIKQITTISNVIVGDETNRKTGDPSKYIEIWHGGFASMRVDEWTDEATDNIKNSTVLWVLMTPENTILGGEKMTLPLKKKDEEEGKRINPQCYYRIHFDPRLCNIERIDGWRVIAYSSKEPFPDTAGYPIYPMFTHQFITGTSIIVPTSDNNGRVISDSELLKYGQYVSLYIDTVGMNLSQFIVEIYRKDDDQNILDQQIIVCRGGYMSVYNINTMKWFFDREKPDEYIVKIKNIYTGAYITNYKDKTKVACTIKFDHNQSVIEPPKVPENVSLSSIEQESLKNFKYSHHCKFSKFSFTTLGQEQTVVFDENGIEYDGSYHYENKKKISYFEFDESGLSKISKNDLSIFANYLKTKGLKVSIEGYADIRGSQAYNYGLSNQRVKAVAEYLLQEGVPADNLEMTAHGKNDLPIEGATTEAEHKENRIVTVIFQFIGISKPAKVYSIVAHNKAVNGQNLNVLIEKYQHQDCLANPTHEPKMSITKFLKEESNDDGIVKLKYAKDEDKKKTEERGTDTNCSLIINAPNLVFSGFSNLFGKLSADYYNEYRYRLNTCAYFPNPDNEVMQLRVYPDTRFVYHGLLNSKNQNYRIDGLKPEDVKLEAPVQISKEMVGVLFDLFFKDKNSGGNLYSMLEGTNALDTIKELVAELITNSFENYKFGVHTLSNFVGIKPDAGSTISHYKDYAENFKYITFVSSSIYIIIEVLLVYFTGGSKAMAKFKKLSDAVGKASKSINTATISQIGKAGKAARALSKAGKAAGVQPVDLSLDLEIFKIATAAQMKYWKTRDNKMVPAYTIEMNLDPLIGIYLSMAFGKGDNEIDIDTNGTATGSVKKVFIDHLVSWLNEFLGKGIKKLTGLSIELEVFGAIGVQDTFSFGYGDGTFYSLNDGDIVSNAVGFNGGRTTSAKVGLGVEVECDLLSGARVLVGTLKDFTGIKNDLGLQDTLENSTATLGADIKAELGLEFHWVIDPKEGPLMELVFKVYPVYGKLYGNIKLKDNDGIDEKESDSSNDNSFKEIWKGTSISIIKIPFLKWLNFNT